MQAQRPPLQNGHSAERASACCRSRSFNPDRPRRSGQPTGLKSSELAFNVSIQTAPEGAANHGDFDQAWAHEQFRSRPPPKERPTATLVRDASSITVLFRSRPPPKERPTASRGGNVAADLMFRSRPPPKERPTTRRPARCRWRQRVSIQTAPEGAANRAISGLPRG